MSITLRPYQIEANNQIKTHWNNGVRNVLFALPTGGGKSINVSDCVLGFDQLGVQSAVIAHRKELIGQMSLHVAKQNIQHRIIGSKQLVGQIIAEHRRELGRSFVSASARCSVIGIDTLVARHEKLKPWAQQVGFWVVDEAHHILKLNKWGRGVAMFPNAFGLGVTATPQRADGSGLGDHNDGVFQALVTGPNMRELIDMGALCEYQIVVPETDFDVASLKPAGSGDFSPQKMREASEKSHIVGDAVEQYLKYASDKQSIVFATDVETSGNIAEKFKASGIAAVSISGETPAAVRSEYIRQFRDAKLQVLVNVDLFGEGFDVPAVEVVVMARPTASLAVYLQQFGRALRPSADKPHGLVIDLVSNVKRHGLPDRMRVWSLDRRNKRARTNDPDDIPIRVCTECFKPYERIFPACPFCGHEPVPATGGTRTVEQVDGDLMLLDFETLKKMRETIEIEQPISVGNRVAMAAGQFAGQRHMNLQIEKIQAQLRLKETIAIWAGHERAKGRPDQQSYRRFYHATGGIDVLSALSLSRVEMDKLHEMIAGWNMKNA